MDRKSIGAIVAGAIVAVLFGVWFIKRETDGESLFDSIGDFIAELTTSEEGRLQKLQPEAQAMFRALINSLEADEGIKVHVGQTLRTPAQEKAVIDAGRSAVKTHSWHELGRAVDLYPINPDTGKADLDGVRVDLFLRMHEKAAALGFRGIAFNADGSKRFITNNAGKKIWDGGHLEWRGPYDTIAEAVEAEGAAYGIA
jgi:hypothetical protein